MDTPQPHAPATGVFRISAVHKWKIVGVWALCLLGALVYTSLAERRFTSEAKIFVRLGRESVKIDPTVTTGQTIDLQESRDGEINSIFELVGSRVVLEKVVTELGEGRILGTSSTKKSSSGPKAWVKSWFKGLDRVNLNPFRVYSTRDKAVDKLTENLKISRPHKTHILVVEYASPDTELSRDVLTALIVAARETNSNMREAPGTQEFFDQQVKLFETKLVELEDNLMQLKNKKGIADIVQQRQVYISRIGVLQEDRAKTMAALHAAEAELVTNKLALTDLPENIVLEEKEGMPAVPEDKMREQLYALELREKRLLAQYQPDHFLVRQVQQQISAARDVMENQVRKTQTTRGINVTRKAIELAIRTGQGQIAGHNAHIESLDKQIDDANGLIGQLNDTQLRIARFDRDIGTTSDQYMMHVNKREQARIDKSLQDEKFTNLSILQPPTWSATPTHPNLFVNLGLAAGLATLVSLGIVLFSDRSVTLVDTVPNSMARSQVDTPVQEANGQKRRAAVATHHPR